MSPLWCWVSPPTEVQQVPSGEAQLLQDLQGEVQNLYEADRLTPNQTLRVKLQQLQKELVKRRGPEHPTSLLVGAFLGAALLQQGARAAGETQLLQSSQGLFQGYRSATVEDRLAWLEALEALHRTLTLQNREWEEKILALRSQRAQVPDSEIERRCLQHLNRWDFFHFGLQEQNRASLEFLLGNWLKYRKDVELTRKTYPHLTKILREILKQHPHISQALQNRFLEWLKRLQPAEMPPPGAELIHLAGEHRKTFGAAALDPFLKALEDRIPDEIHFDTWLLRLFLAQARDDALSQARFLKEGLQHFTGEEAVKVWDQALRILQERPDPALALELARMTLEIRPLPWNQYEAIQRLVEILESQGAQEALQSFMGLMPSLEMGASGFPEQVSDLPTLLRARWRFGMSQGRYREVLEAMRLHRSQMDWSMGDSWNLILCLLECEEKEEAWRETRRLMEDILASPCPEEMDSRFPRLKDLHHLAALLKLHVEDPLSRSFLNALAAEVDPGMERSQGRPEALIQLWAWRDAQKDAVDLDPSIEVLLGRAKSLKGKASIPTLREALKRIPQEHPQRPFLLLQLAEQSLEVDPAQALNWIREALGLSHFSPRRLPILSLAASLGFQLGEPECLDWLRQAFQNIEDVLDGSKESRKAAEQTVFLYILLADTMEQYGEALEVIQRTEVLARRLPAEAPLKKEEAQFLKNARLIIGRKAQVHEILSRARLRTGAME